MFAPCTGASQSKRPSSSTIEPYTACKVPVSPIALRAAWTLGLTRRVRSASEIPSAAIAVEHRRIGEIVGREGALSLGDYDPKVGLARRVKRVRGTIGDEWSRRSMGSLAGVTFKDAGADRIVSDPRQHRAPE